MRCFQCVYTWKNSVLRWPVSSGDVSWPRKMLHWPEKLSQKQTQVKHSSHSYNSIHSIDKFVITFVICPCPFATTQYCIALNMFRINDTIQILIYWWPISYVNSRCYSLCKLDKFVCSGIFNLWNTFSYRGWKHTARK